MAEEQNSEHVISLFRMRMRDLTPAQGEQYASTFEQLFTIASAMPGFVSFRRYASEDGETLAVVEFASAAALAAWRNHPDHRDAQQRGRNEFYAEYEIVNCAVLNKRGYRH